MSFGGFGSGNASSGGFGGFGSSNNTGFGANNNTSTSGSIFGAGNTSTSGGFGSGGAFGSNNASTPFGAKPTGGFGSTPATSAPSLFGGGNTSTSGGFGSGGFGNTNNTTSAFGGASSGGGLFGNANKPATGGFGTSNNTGSIFGGGGSTGGFGSNANSGTSNPFSSNTGTSTGFGASNTTTNTGFGGGGFGASNTAANNNGTAGAPFNAFTEKDAASNQMSHYQSITTQQPYMGKSFEELRTEDYMQGRRYGNSNGQAGSFGQSTGFGGSVFGGGNQTNNAPSTGLFGSSNNNTTSGGGFGGFGSNNTQTATGGFGASNTGSTGLFGANKPATTGLFGSTTQTSGATTGGFGSNTSGSTGGLFGGGGSAFGGNNQQTSTTSLFGGNNQQQNKPAGFGFGTGNTTTGAFGNNTTQSGGLFGNNNNNNQSTGTTGLFGQNNQQQQSNPFGGSTNTSTGLFGNTQNKPAATGLFGSSTANTSNTGTGLFGASNNNQQQSGGLFGASNNQQQSGGLFGNNNQSKPATTGLFGSTATNNTSGGGLFGSNQSNQQQTSSLFGNSTGGSSLFGGNNQNKPAGTSLFGNNNTSNTGGGLFGSSTQGNQQNQQSTNSLFGSTNQNTQQGNGNSLFGSSFGGSTQTPQQNQLHASLTMAPYGNDQLFSSLGQSSTPVGPLATPLAGARAPPSRTPSLLSSTKLSSPIFTPRLGGINYGFSYSTYGTPGSAFSVSLTPQQSSLLKPTGSLGSALTSRLAKSMSMHNLRSDATSRDGESLLRPTPGSASSKYLQSGSMRKLIIDRNMRTDIFAPSPEPARSAPETEHPTLSKKVSFDNTAGKQTTAEPNSSNALVRTEEESEEETSPQMFRAAHKPSKATSNGRPEMEQVNGSGLSSVPEDGGMRPASAPATKKPAEKRNSKSLEVGDYWTKPAIKDLKNMSRTQLQKLGKFTVGREGVGYIVFGPCDLTNTNLDDICGQICDFKLRSVTVYPEKATKPPRGQGLNVPSTIHLENSWPRSHGGRKAVLAKSGPAFDKHLARLRSTMGTTFQNYDADTGVWSFTVEHFTTYGLLDEDDEYTEDMEDTDVQQESSVLSEPPQDDTLQSIEAPLGTPEDDTFGHKTKRAFPSFSPRQRGLPGGFDESHISMDYDDPSADEGVEDEHMMTGGLGDANDSITSAGGAVLAPSPNAVERYHSSMSDIDGDSGAIDLAEEPQIDPETDIPGSFVVEEEPKQLRSILKPTAGLISFASPEKLATEPWEEQLQRTISPKKRDRQALKDLQQSLLREPQEDAIESPFKRSMLGQSALGQSYLAQKSAKKVGFGVSTMGGDEMELGKSQAFRTSMDIMNSLWAQEKTATKKVHGGARGFENPYPKRPRLSTFDDLDEQDAAFHNSFKPTFTNNGTVIYSVSGAERQVQQSQVLSKRLLAGEHKDVRFAKWADSTDVNTETLTVQKQATVVEEAESFPIAQMATNTHFADLESATVNSREKSIWKLADILFDTVTVACKDLTQGMSPEEVVHFEPRLRTDAFMQFWTQMMESSVNEQVALAQSAEEKALLRLTVNDISGACEILVAAKNFKLATVISQLPGSIHSRKLMRSQIEAWRNRNDWSEMTEPIRALYSIAAGEVCTVSGKSGHAENRVSTFNLAERFGLSWTQSFGLRVLYGGHASLVEAVDAYCDDLQNDREKAVPLPWWNTQETPAEAGTEDPLLGVLRLAASRADLESIFDAKTVSGSAVNSRIAWQVATIFSAKGPARDLGPEKLDQLTVVFAAELEAAGFLVSAAWVLLHLNDDVSRKQAVSELLHRNAGLISEPKTTPESTDGSWEYLVEDNKIAPNLLWSAKALHARAELGDSHLQATCLLNARALEEAHEVLCTTIGPKAVIEEEYDQLNDILNRFEGHVDGWQNGGGVFQDFVQLVSMTPARKHSREGEALLRRLRDGVRSMRGREDAMGLEEKVAVFEMERVVGEEIREIFGRDREQEVDVAMGGVAGGFEAYRAAMGMVA